MKFLILLISTLTLTYAEAATHLSSCERIAHEEVFYSANSSAKIIQVSGVVCGINPRGQQCQIFQYIPMAEMDWTVDKINYQVKKINWGETLLYKGVLYGCGTW